MKKNKAGQRAGERVDWECLFYIGYTGKLREEHLVRDLNEGDLLMGLRTTCLATDSTAVLRGYLDPPTVHQGGGES